MFKFFLFLLFLTLHSDFCFLQKVNQSTINNFDLNSPDLLLDFKQENVVIHLEAFKSSFNDQIIKEGNATKFGQLHWVSIGNPRLEFNNSTSLFDFHPLGFSIKVQMLTEEHKQKIVEAIKDAYGICIKPRQILNFIPKKFECSFNFYDANEAVSSINGKVKNFQEFPLRVEFDAPLNQGHFKCNQRCLFEKYIQNETNALNLQFDCKLDGSKEFTLYAKHTNSVQNFNFAIDEYLKPKFDDFRKEINKDLSNFQSKLDAFSLDFQNKLSNLSELPNKNETLIQNISNVDSFNNITENLRANLSYEVSLKNNHINYFLLL